MSDATPTPRASWIFRPIAVSRSALWRARRRAAGLHLLLSLLALLPVAWLVAVRWYPMPFFLTDGGWHGLRILLAVGLVAGPGLTLLAAHPAKTRLATTLDLGGIVAVQLAGVLFGLWLIAEPRPALVSLHRGELQTVRWDMLAAQGMDRPTFDARFGAGGAPRLAYARMPIPGSAEAQAVAARVFEDAIPAGWNVDLLEPLAAHPGAIAAAGVALEARPDLDAAGVARGRAIAERAAREGLALHWLPLRGRYRSGYLALDGQGRIVDWVLVGGG